MADNTERWFKAEIDGSEVTWRGGKFSSDNKELLDKIRETGKHISNCYDGLALDGSLLTIGHGCDFEKNVFTAFALLQKCCRGYLDVVEGYRPTWDDLGQKSDGNAIY